MKKLMVAALVIAALGTSVPSQAQQQRDVIVSMIDTGVYPWHQEFDYRGKDSLDDQFVAWWDFSGDRGPQRSPLPGELWDTRAAEPYDATGHGTATAAVAVGRNRGWGDWSYAPGFKLAVAKVGGRAGITGSIADAIRWSVDTVGANVINISIGSTTPRPAGESAAVYDALSHARRHGALVVVSNGNGFLNYGIPGEPGWAGWYGSSPDVLTVGAAGLDGVTSSTDPEVAARFSVYTACAWDEWCYEEVNGTSFAAPTVAGMAATAMQRLIDGNRAVSIDWVERLLKYSARDTAVPPTLEGYGVLGDNEFRVRVEPSARSGRLPDRPVPDVNAAYVDGAGAALRDTWSNTARQTVIRIGPSVTSWNEIGPSAPSLFDGELYKVTLEAGERLFMFVDFAWPNDIDVRMYRAGGAMDQARQVAASTNAVGSDEFISHRSEMGGDYVVLIYGWAVAAPAKTYVYGWTTSGATPEPEPLSQGTYAVTIPF